MPGYASLWEAWSHCNWTWSLASRLLLLLLVVATSTGAAAAADLFLVRRVTGVIRHAARRRRRRRWQLVTSAGGVFLEHDGDGGRLAAACWPPGWCSVLQG